MDEDLKIIIPEGTQILNANGYPLRTITVTTIIEPVNCPDEACFIGNAYDIGPRGITFDNPVYLTMSYDADEIPENGTEGRLRIACRNEASETWEYLEGEVDTEASAITAVLHHFSQYAVILPTHPARFVASPLMVTPAAADRDTIITAGTMITNTGDLTGSYTLVCLLDGKLLKQENMRLRGGESRDIEVTFRAGKTGIHHLDFNGVRSSYEVLPVPASFQLSGLVVSPGSVTAGESVSVSVTVTNSGEAGGDYYIECSIDGTAAGSRAYMWTGFPVTRPLLPSRQPVRAPMTSISTKYCSGDLRLKRLRSYRRTILRTLNLLSLQPPPRLPLHRILLQPNPLPPRDGG